MIKTEQEVSKEQEEMILNNLPSLGPDHLIIKEILFGPPEQLVDNIQKVKQIPPENCQKWKDHSPLFALACSKKIIKQFKLMENWNIDHEKLWKSLQEMNEKFPFNLSRIAKQILIDKIADGILYIKILQKISRSNDFSTPNIFNRNAEIHQSSYMAKISQAYKIIKSQNSNKESLQYKRYNALDEQNKLRYQIMLNKILYNNQFIKLHRSQPRMQNIFVRQNQLNNSIINSQYSPDKFYNMLDKIEYNWFLQHLLDFKGQKAAEVKKYIISLKLQKKQQNQNTIISLSADNPSKITINSKILTKQVLNLCLDEQNLIFMSNDSILLDKEAIYLKYDLSNDISIGFQNIFPQQIERELRSNMNNRNANPQLLNKIKSVLTNGVSNTYLLIKYINSGKKVYIFESNNKFSDLNQSLQIKILKFCLQYISQIMKSEKKAPNITHITQQLFSNKELIEIFCQILSFIQNKQPKIIREIFESICHLILKIVLRNEQKMAIMNNSNFLQIFIVIINKITQDSTLNHLPFVMEKFFIHYIPTLFTFGLNVDKLPLKRIFQLKIRGNHDSSNSYRSGVHISHNNLTHQRQNIFSQKQQSNLNGFIEAFPSSIQYFSQKIIQNINNFQLQISQINIFDIKKSQKLQQFFKLLGNQKIKVPEQFSQKINELIFKYPSYFILHHDIINWSKIKINSKLNISQQISKNVTIVQDLLTKTLIVDTIDVKQLCQGGSSNNEDLIQLLNKLNNFNILLKMRDEHDKCSFIKQLVNITLKLQQIESISLNRIVQHQATYCLLRVKQIREIMKEIGDRNSLHFKIYQFVSYLIQTCWSYFSKFDLQHTDILLKQYKIYINKLIISEDRNLILKLLKKTYRHFGQISRQKQINLNYQLYNHNSNEIYNLLTKLNREFGINKQKRDTVVMGQSYLRFIQKCIEKKLHPAQQFNKIIAPHIHDSLIQIIEFIFFQINNKQTLLGQTIYSGRKNTQMVLKSVFYDLKKKILLNFSLNDIHFYEKMINIRSIASQIDNIQGNQQQKILNLKPSQFEIQILTIQQRQQKHLILYNKLLQKLQQYRYSKTNLLQIQSLYIQITNILKNKHNIKQAQLGILKLIIKQMSQKDQNQIIDEDIFKGQCSWIDKILLSEDIKNQEFLNQQFIKKYLKFQINILNKPEQNKEILINSLKIIQKIIPSELKVSNNQIYARCIFDIIQKILLIRVNQEKYKIIYQRIINKVLLAIIKSGQPIFYPYIDRFFNIIKEDQIYCGHLFCQMLEKQAKFISMEADIKGYFLKESENLVDESQIRISTKLQNFIHVFKDKYQQQIVTFSNIVSKFVKKTVENENNKEIVYLTYDKSNKYHYSQLSKINFIHFQPKNMIKHIIKSLMQKVNGKMQDLKYVLQSLKILIYYYPVILPYLMMHPLQNSEKVFLDYLMDQICSKRQDFINQFILYACLDHSCILNLEHRAIFFSQYLCFRILKHLSQYNLNKYTLSFIYEMNQLKRFSYLCKINITKDDNLVEKLLGFLRQKKEGLQFATTENNIVYLILSVIMKQDHIDNLKKCFVPKKIKQSKDYQYKLIDDCLIPFNVYFRKKNKLNILEKRQDNIAYTGTTITPFYPEIYSQIIMDQQYPSLKINYNVQIIQESSSQYSLQSCYNNFDINYLETKQISSKTYRYTNHIDYLKSGYNDQHKRMIQKIKDIYLKEESKQPQDNREEEDYRERQRIMMNNYQRNRNTPMPRNIFLRQENRIAPHRTQMIGRFQRQQRSQRNRRVQPSRFAQQDFNVNTSTNKKQSNKLQKEFQDSLSNIPSVEQIQQKQQFFSQIKTNQSQLQIILSQINDKLFLMNKQPFDMKEIKNKNFLEKKQYLQLKDIEIDFDFNKYFLSEDQFQQYCLIKAVKFDKLTGERRQQVRVIEENMLLMNIARTKSSDCIEDIIETIDVNYQLIPNIKKTLSRSQSITSYEQNKQNEQLQGFHFQSNSLPIRAFSDVKEQLIFQMILQNYYLTEHFMCKQLMPFLENMKIQHSIISTILFIMKNPINNDIFPKHLFKFQSSTLQWTKKQTTNNNVQMNFFCDRFLMVFQSVKNYSFYQNDNFLLEEISCDGIMGIKYEPIYKIQGKDGIYVPIYQILHYILTNQSNVSVLDLIKGVKELPEDLMNKLFKKLIQLEKKQDQNENDDDFHSSNIFARSRGRKRKPVSTLSYENMGQLFKNQTFQSKFKEFYPFETEKPNFSLLSHLIDYNVYSDQQLKTLNLNILANRPKNSGQYFFVNKIFKIYTQNELETSKWIQQYHQSLLKTVEYLNAMDIKIQEEPISRIFKLTNRMSFEMKKILLKRDLQKARRKYQTGQYEGFDRERTEVISKKIKGIFNSAFEDLRLKPDSFWRSPFGVRFIDQNGIRQSGFGDGVKRQWFTLLSKAMVNLDTALFIRTPQNYYHFNKESQINPRHLQYLQFIGKLFGYTLLKNQLFISPSFSTTLYKLILGQKITIEDIIQQFQEGEYIQKLRNMLKSAKSNEDFIGIDLNFTYRDKRLISNKNYQILKQSSKKLYLKQKQIKNKGIIYSQYAPFKVIKELQQKKEEQQKLPEEINVFNIYEILQLKPGGAQIMVNYDNMYEYVKLYEEKVLQMLVDSIHRQYQAFLSGLKGIVNPKYLSRFNAKELRLLIEGTKTISIADLKQYTRDDTDKITSQWLWSALEQISDQQKLLFVWNWTGVDKMPAQGAKVMNLRIYNTNCVNIISHTCSKGLQIPQCKSLEQMRTKVTIVINNIKTGKALIED